MLSTTNLDTNAKEAEDTESSTIYGADAQAICLNLEAGQIRCVMESIVQAFRAHKKYIEKEITQQVNKLTMMKK